MSLSKRDQFMCTVLNGLLTTSRELDTITKEERLTLFSKATEIAYELPDEMVRQSDEVQEE